jgi:hypothetical protein
MPPRFGGTGRVAGGPASAAAVAVAMHTAAAVAAASAAAASAMVTSFLDRRRAQLHDGRELGSECFNEYFCYVLGLITIEMTTMSALFMMKESDLVVYFKDRSNNGDGNRLNA